MKILKHRQSCEREAGRHFRIHHNCYYRCLLKIGIACFLGGRGKSARQSTAEKLGWHGCRSPGLHMEGLKRTIRSPRVILSTWNIGRLGPLGYHYWVNYWPYSLHGPTWCVVNFNLGGFRLPDSPFPVKLVWFMIGPTSLPYVSIFVLTCTRTTWISRMMTRK